MNYGNFETDGLVEQRKELDSLLMSNPDMEKKVQGLIRKVLAQVKKDVGEAAQKSSVMKSDPRQSYKAVRTLVYKRILGGNVNILRKKKASGKTSDYTPDRTGRMGERGGNRRPVSERTKQINGYVGSDRGFILRFLNAGTVERHTRYGSRGHIDARPFFGASSKQAMEKAAEDLCKMIDELIQKELK